MRFYSGRVFIEVVYDSEGRTHRLSPPGVYRARVQMDDVDDSIIVGAIKADNTNEAIERVAEAALEFSIGDHPQLVDAVLRDERGRFVFATVRGDRATRSRRTA